MPMTSLFTSAETEQPIKNPEIRSLIAEANKIDDDRWRVITRIKTIKRFFKKDQSTERYVLIYRISQGIEYQVLNLHKDYYHNSPEAYSAHDICNYLMGYLAGQAHARMAPKESDS